MAAELEREKSMQATASRMPRVGIPLWAIVIVASILAGAVVATDRNLPVLLPTVAIVWVAGAFYGSLAGRGGEAALEVGTVYAAVVTLYAVFPLVGYITNGLKYNLTSEGRLYLYQPTPGELGRVAWFYVIHLVSFCVAYRILRGSRRFHLRLRSPRRLRIVLVVGLMVSIAVYFWILGKVFDLTVEDYSQSYLILRRLPLLVAQVTNHVGGMKFTLEVALLVTLCANFRRHRLLIAGLLLLIGASTFTRLWSRTEFVLLSAGTLMAYHWLAKPLSERLLAVGAAAVVSLFLAAGILRGGFLQSQDFVGWNPFAYSNEFESLLGNVYDLDQRRAAHDVNVSLGFRLVDLLALVPQQLSPIQKVEPAEWYVREFYPDFAAGGSAFAFGTLAESIVGGGVADLIARGVVLGVVLGLFHRWASRRKEGFWSVVIYVWMTLTVYQCFRNTTFYPVVLFVYRVLPVILAVEVLESMFRGPTRSAVPRPAAAPVAQVP
jgi:hypothetical protein